MSKQHFSSSEQSWHDVSAWRWTCRDSSRYWEKFVCTWFSIRYGATEIVNDKDCNVSLMLQVQCTCLDIKLAEIIFKINVAVYRLWNIRLTYTAYYTVLCTIHGCIMWHMTSCTLTISNLAWWLLDHSCNKYYDLIGQRGVCFPYFLSHRHL